MSFFDLLFIFRFLPVLLAVYYIVPAPAKRAVLLFASLLFYSFGDLRFLTLLIVATLTNHLLGRDVLRKSKGVFVLIVALDVLLLVAFKSLGAFADTQFVPVGISFYIFKMISYQADLYRGSIGEAPSFIDTASYFTLFAQIISGPIMRFSDYAAPSAVSLRFARPNERGKSYLTCLEDGCFYFITGLACKVILADHLAMCWQAIGTIGYGHISTQLAWIGVLCYALNLYYDFWGYSLMAGGIGVALGLPFIENFHHPYAAEGVADFYRRWHMTLGSFFRDYIYIPLGGSRGGWFRTLFNLLVVWLLTSLWHGFSLNFLIWGMSLFLLIVWEKMVLSHVPLLHKILGRVHVLLFVPLTWIPFAISRTDHLFAYFNRLFPFAHLPANVYRLDYVGILNNYTLYFVLGLIGLVPTVFSILKRHRRNPLVALFLLVLFWLSIYSLVGSEGNPFLYFRF